MVKFFLNKVLSVILFGIQSINRRPLAAKKWHRSNIVFPIMQHWNSPLADMLSPFNNTSIAFKVYIALIVLMFYVCKAWYSLFDFSFLDLCPCKVKLCIACCIGSKKTFPINLGSEDWLNLYLFFSVCARLSLALVKRHFFKNITSLKLG